MNKSEFLGLNLPSRDNTTDIADINAISDNFEIIDGVFLDLTEKQIPEFQTKENMNLNFDDNSTNEEQYPSVPAVVNFTNRKVNPLKIVNSASGNAIAIKDSAKDKLVNLKLYGKTTQDGTPTPTEPKELKSVGDSGSFEVGVYGKNKLKGIHNSVKNNYETLVQIGNRVFIPKGTNVTVSVYVSATSATKVYWNNASKITDYKEVSIPSGETRITYSFVASADIDTKGVKLPLLSKVPTSDGITITPQKAQIEFNSVATDYEPIINEPLTMPYTLRSVPNATSTGEALGVGETSDIVDFNKGIKAENILKVTLDGTGSMREHANGMLYVQLYGNKTNYKFRAGCGICNQLTNAFTNKATGNVFHIGTEGVYIGKNDSFSTVDELKAHLTTNPMIFYITLQTPIETPLSETELNAYRQLHTNKPTTTILSEAEMLVDYVADPKNYIDNKIAELTALTLEV